MIEYDIVWSPKAYKDIDKISYYLKEEKIAKKLIRNILNSISTLKHFPERYAKIEDINKDNIRKMLVKNYVVIYEVDSDTRASFYFTYLSWKTKLYK